MEVKGSEAQGRCREVGSEGRVEQRYGPMNKNRMHPARLCICKLLEQGRVTDQQQYRSESGAVWTWCRLRKNNPTPCHSSGDTAALRNDNSFGGQNYTNTNSSASASCPLEIVYNNKCCLRRTMSRAQKLPTTISSRSMSYKEMGE